MKKICLLMAVLMVLTTFCSCGGAKNNSTLEGNVYLEGFPIVKEQETLEIFTVNTVNHGDFDEMGFTKYYEEKTNIHIDWLLASSAEIDSKLTLMFQSNSLPDIISLPLNLFGSDRLLKYSKTGAVIQLDDLIEKYGTNIKAMLDKSPEAKTAALAADGKIYSLPTIQKMSNNHERFPQKLYIRKTWLDNLGLEVPKTAEEFYEVMNAFKNNDPNGNGIKDEIPFATRGIDPSFYGNWGISFNYNNDALCVDDNGKVSYGYATDATKKALSFMNRLYSLGLCEMYDSDSKFRTKLKNGVVGAFYHLAAYTVVGNEFADEYLMIEPFEGTSGVKPVMSVSGTYYPNTFIITSACENPAAAIRWVDHLYSDEGFFLVTYGRDGDMIEKNSDGKWQYADYDTSKDRFTFTPGFVLPYYVDDEVLSNFVDKAESEMTDSELFDKKLDEETKNTYLGKSEPKNLIWMPAMDEQAQKIIDQYYDNIAEYAGTAMGEFATGVKNIDTEWDAYIAELNKKGLPLVLAEYQRLYDANKSK